jgi:putative YphP/YqiW family bacilliredoxin
MYDQMQTQPMELELQSIGVKPLHSPSEVDAALNEQGTKMIVVNSVCGCATGKARPGVKLALENSITPDKSYTVFAGVNTQATNKAREYITGYMPSSPAIAIFKDKEVVFVMQRHDIENKEAQQIAEELKKAFDKHC